MDLMVTKSLIVQGTFMLFEFNADEINRLSLKVSMLNNT